MQVKMKKTKRGSADGINVIEYKLGHTYDIPLSLYEIFLSLGVVNIQKTTPEKTQIIKPKKTRVVKPKSTRKIKKKK